MSELFLRGMLTPRQTLTGKLSVPNPLVGVLSCGYVYHYVDYQETEGGESSNNMTFIESEPLPESLLSYGVTSVTLTHHKTGFGCFLLNVSPTRVEETYYVKIKNIGLDTADIDIVNTGQEYVGSIGTAYWLCVSLSAVNTGSEPGGGHDVPIDDVQAASTVAILDQAVLGLSTLGVDDSVPSVGGGGVVTLGRSTLGSATLS